MQYLGHNLRRWMFSVLCENKGSPIISVSKIKDNSRFLFGWFGFFCMFARPLAFRIDCFLQTIIIICSNTAQPLHLPWIQTLTSLLIKGLSAATCNFGHPQLYKNHPSCCLWARRLTAFGHSKVVIQESTAISITLHSGAQAGLSCLCEVTSSSQTAWSFCGYDACFFH